MSRSDIAFQVVLVALWMLESIGSIALLVFLRRRTRRWWAAFAGTLVAVPVGGFLLTGGVAWLWAVSEVVLGGDTTDPAKMFILGGFYGVLFAGAGFGLSLVPFGLWGIVHPASFCRVTRWES